jgi:hypothetical protein
MERSSKDDRVVDVVFQLAARTVDRPDRILDQTTASVLKASDRVDGRVEPNISF